ncbi:MAG: T9SS type A sorting domain-containing protein [Cyclobacteriaceae bacterium]
MKQFKYWIAQGLLLGMCAGSVTYNVEAQTVQKQNGALTDTEKASFREWATNRKTSDSSNWENNKWQFRYFDFQMQYWVYNMSGDIRIVNNLMSIAETAYLANNIRDQRDLWYIGWDAINSRPIGEITTGWPRNGHYEELDIKNRKVNSGDGGELVIGAAYMSIAARVIVETPDIWHQLVPDKDYTYLQRALVYIDESIDAVDAFRQYFTDPVTCRQQFQFNFPPSDRDNWRKKGGYGAFNRVGHTQTLLCYLIPCLEQLGIRPDKLEEFESINQAAVDTWMDSMNKYTYFGIKVLDYPYAYQRPNSEDIGHGANDICQWGALHRSGRYPEVNDDVMARIANTLVHIVKKGDEYAYRFDGTGSGTQPHPFYLQLNRYNKGLSNTVKNNNAILLFARAFEDMSITCQINEEEWKSTKSIAVKPGDELTILGDDGEGETNWTWSGPNDLTHEGNSISFDAVTYSDAGTYEVTHVSEFARRTNYVKIVVYNPDDASVPCDDIKNIRPSIRAGFGAWRPITDTTVMAGSPIAFDMPAHFGDWKWTGPNGFESSSRTIRFYAIQPEHSGEYECTYTNSCDEELKASFSVEVEKPIVLSDSKSPLLVYPNPFRDVIHIDNSEGNYDSCVLMDTLGKVIAVKADLSSHKTIEWDVTTLDLDGHVFFLRMLGNDKVETIKVLRNR